MSAVAAKMAADVKWCSSCQAVGIKSRIRIMQINLEEAALICENKECTANFTSTKVLPRSVSRLAGIKRKRQRQSLSSPPSNPPTDPMSPPPTDFTQDHLPNGIPGSTNTGTLPLQSQLRTQLWEDKVLQWHNKDALCWLDVSMCALVHCTSLRLCLRRLGEASILRELCSEFDRAQLTETQKSDCGPDGLVKQLSRSNHDRLLQNQNGHCEVNKVGGGGHPIETLSKTNASNPSHSDSVNSSLQPSLTMNNLEAEAAMEWLVMSDEDAAKQRELFIASKSNQHEQNSEDCETKQTAQDILEDIREKLWKALEIKLGCELGKEETPVFALPLLARLSGAVEEHFLTRYRWEFYCNACHYTNVTTCKKVMMSFSTLASNFKLSSPVMVKACPACKSPNQTNHLEYHSCPSCMMFHFSEGVQDPDVMSYNFETDSGSYEVSCVIQYVSNDGNPNHFIAWIRDEHRDMWLKCNDLESPVCEWETQAPSIPPSEIHIIIVERQGDPCTMCDAISSDMNRIRTNVDHIVGKMSALNGNNSRKTHTAPAKKTTGGDNVSNSAVDTCSVLKSKNRFWQQKPSRYQSYSNGANRDATPSHLTVIDLDEKGDIDNNSLPDSIGTGSEESWSRSSSPLTVSSTRARKRSLPNYLLTSSSTKCATKTAFIKVSQKSPNKNTSGTCKVPQVQPIAADIQFGNADVYSRKTRSNRRIPNRNLYSSGRKNSFPSYSEKLTRKNSFPSYSETVTRKNSFPSYSETQAHKTGQIQHVQDAALAVSLPEGAFVRCSLWQRKHLSDNSSDRSTNSSPADLQLQTNSLLTKSNLPRPRCDSLSSVSSPSACSDLSSFSDNSSSVNSVKDDLCSTIDELYKALEIGNPMSTSQSRIPSPTLDDDFLAEILADDPIPAALPSTSDTRMDVKESTSVPSLVKAGSGSLELDGIVPSIEPMTNDLLAKLVA